MATDRAIAAPWRLLPNRVTRFYRGGMLLDEFRGVARPSDTNEPEDWVGSTTRAWTPPDAPPTDEGLAEAEVDGRRARVADLLAADPIAVAGAVFAAAGPTTGVLVKLLDAAIRLPVHAHPSRTFAGRHLGSRFGKAEAWIVLGTRQVPGEPAPHVRLGFRREVAREELRGWIDREATEPLLDALHVRETRAGDTWFVPAGTPHAIGAGVFILEVQEPSDFSIVAETRGVPIDRGHAHLGLGWDVTIDAIDRRPLGDGDLDGLRGAREAGAAEPVRQREPLLSRDADPYFRADRLRIDAAARPFDADPPTFTVLVVDSGSGVARAGWHAVPLERGSVVGVPAAALGSLEIESTGAPLELIACRPGTAAP